MDFSSLYDQAIATTKQCKAHRDALLDTPEEFLQKIKDARDSLYHTIVDTASDKIMSAAEQGHSVCSLYAFNGNDFVKDISILFLLKGPKPMTPRLPDGTPDPLLPELQRVMHPFEIVHDWDGISGGNRLLARWPVSV